MKKLLLIAILWVFSNGLVMAQCAMCRATVSSTMSNGRNHVGVGLNTGILYLLATPYLVALILGIVWYKISKKEHTRKMELAKRVQAAMNKSID